MIADAMCGRGGAHTPGDGGGGRTAERRAEQLAEEAAAARVETEQYSAVASDAAEAAAVAQAEAAAAAAAATTAATAATTAKVCEQEDQPRESAALVHLYLRELRQRYFSSAEVDQEARHQRNFEEKVEAGAQDPVGGDPGGWTYINDADSLLLRASDFHLRQVRTTLTRSFLAQRKGVVGFTLRRSYGVHLVGFRGEDTWWAALSCIGRGTWVVFVRVCQAPASTNHGAKEEEEALHVFKREHRFVRLTSRLYGSFYIESAADWREYTPVGGVVQGTRQRPKW